jgi:hypothetical protein
VTRKAWTGLINFGANADLLTISDLSKSSMTTQKSRKMQIIKPRKKPKIKPPRTFATPETTIFPKNRKNLPIRLNIIKKSINKKVKTAH